MYSGLCQLRPGLIWSIERVALVFLFSLASYMSCIVKQHPLHASRQPHMHRVNHCCRLAIVWRRPITVHCHRALRGGSDTSDRSRLAYTHNHTRAQSRMSHNHCCKPIHCSLIAATHNHCCKLAIVRRRPITVHRPRALRGGSDTSGTGRSRLA